jgi:hypothetical protein
MKDREQILDSAGNGRARTHDCVDKFRILAAGEQALIKYREQSPDPGSVGEALIKWGTNSRFWRNQHSV